MSIEAVVFVVVGLSVILFLVAYFVRSLKQVERDAIEDLKNSSNVGSTISNITDRFPLGIGPGFKFGFGFGIGFFCAGVFLSLLFFTIFGFAIGGLLSSLR
jgi:hypothetical protein